MEEFKKLEDLTSMDEKHQLMGALTGTVPDLESMHKALSKEELNEAVPDVIRGQFNVARNMAIYSYFFYALSPEVHLKTYILIEHALKLKAKADNITKLGDLLGMAVKRKWISDSGFRHIKAPSDNNEWCKSLRDVLRKLRNSGAHGSDMLVGDCLHHIRVCADFINQLYPNPGRT